MRPGDGTAALDKSLDVLDAVGGAAQVLTQTDIAARLGLPRTTLYRLLGTLVSRGMLRRDPARLAVTRESLEAAPLSGQLFAVRS